MQLGRRNVGLDRVDGAFRKFFDIRQVCEMYIANGKDVFCAFMDLEKAYDTINRHCKSQV